MKKKKEKEKNRTQDATDEIERQDHSFVWESRYERWAPPFISLRAFPAKMYSWVPEKFISIHFKQQWKEILAIEGGTFIYLHVHLLSLYSQIPTKWSPLKKWKVAL